jgi:hypothetical protein
MDGSPIDFIIIPIIAVVSLIAWLVPIYWADSHPRRGGNHLPEQADASAAAPSPPAVTVAPRLPQPGDRPASVPGASLTAGVADR